MRTEQARPLAKRNATAADSAKCDEKPFIFSGEWPASLPRVPTGMGFGKDNDGIQLAITQYDGNPVSACALFKNLLEREQNAFDTRHKAWLKSALDAAQPLAIAMLKRDLESAQTRKDLRGVVIASIVADAVIDQGIPEGKSFGAALKARLFSGEAAPNPVWKILEVEGQRIGETYSENSGPSSVTVSAKAGFELLRVAGRAQNISSESDPPYVLWCLGGIKGDVARAVRSPGEESGRFADSEFISLLTGGGDMLPCSYVCNGSQMGSLRITFEKGVLSVGEFVKSGDGLKFDLVFLVPKGLREYRLLILGSTPVGMPIEAEK